MRTLASGESATTSCFEHSTAGCGVEAWTVCIHPKDTIALACSRSYVVALTWSPGCLSNAEHDRSEVVRRLELVLKSSGFKQLLLFADLQRFSRHIIPFTPARVKESVLSDAFSELHGLDKALLLSNGWAEDSYLELISSPHARYWWSGCIGAKRSHCSCALALLFNVL